MPIVKTSQCGRAAQLTEVRREKVVLLFAGEGPSEMRREETRTGAHPVSVSRPFFRESCPALSERVFKVLQSQY